MKNWTNQKLFSECRRRGQAALEAKRLFIALLPEVARRELWKEKGFSSIYHFAAKLGGVTFAQVEEVVRLEKRLQDKPALHRTLLSGKVSASKLARVAVIATHENDAELAQIARVVSREAINTMIRDQKSSTGRACGDVSPICQPELDADVAAELKTLQDKGIDINAELREFLKARREKIEEEKQAAKPTKTVTLPTKQLLKKEYGIKCAKCDQPADQIHHVKHRAWGGSNLPNNLIPLCKDHHALEHVNERVKIWKC